MTQIELAELIKEIWNDNLDATDLWVTQQFDHEPPIIVNESMYLSRFHSTLHSAIWGGDYTEEEKETLWHLARQMLAAAQDVDLPEA